LQATVSDFAQEAQAGTESLIALVNQMGQQLQATDLPEAREIHR
jgi:hypothetical protein